MGLRARHEKEKENMRRLILKAAIKIIIAEGYDKLSMRKIADEIEYSPTTIYIYYKDKAQIVRDISNRIYEKIVHNTKKILEENKDVAIEKQLELSFRAFIITMTDDIEMGKAVIKSGTDAMFSPETDETQEKDGIVMLQNLLLKGQQQSILRKLDDNVSWMLITALIGFSMDAIESKKCLAPNWPELVGIYIEILINGLLAR